MVARFKGKCNAGKSVQGKVILILRPSRARECVTPRGANTGAVASNRAPVKSGWSALVCWGPKALKWNENRPYTEASRQASAKWHTQTDRQLALLCMCTVHPRLWQLKSDMYLTLITRLHIFNFLVFIILRPKVSKLNIKSRQHPKGLLSLKLNRYWIILQLQLRKTPKCHKVISWI